MTQINLLPWREEYRRLHKKEFFFEIGLAVALALVTLTLLHLIVNRQLNFQETRNSLLQQKIDQITAINLKYSAVAKQKEKLQLEVQNLADLHNDRFRVVRILDELVRVIPKELYLTKIEYKNHLIIIHGEAQNEGQIARLLDNVNHSPWFTEPNLTEIVATQKDKVYKKSFQLVTKFEDTGA